MAPSASELRARLDGLMPVDRAMLRRRLRGTGKLSGRRRREVMAEIATAVTAAEDRLEQRRGAAPETIAYPEDLPITLWREELLAAIASNQVVIVAGETGSGKSTQLPKMCLELGRGVTGMIGHTQPRRIAARSVAERIAVELQSSVGDIVGYTVRFTDEAGPRTLVRVMTDGILLNELQRDRRLERYDTIIIDEAHERSLNIDFLLGYLKQLLAQRADMKLIITSATIDTARFAAHFDDAPVVEVSGRGHPVEIRYRPLVAEGREPGDQVDGIVAAVRELSGEGPGDMLVFCSGEREIRDTADALRDLELRHTEIMPLYGRLSAGEQHRVFAPHTGRRIVVATNVAETSLTVPGIRYVIDAGTARISRFSRRTKVQRLPIEAISQAAANQRAGRCGRLGPGICIRLYSAEDFAGRPEFTEPEILRTNLASVILQMAAIGLGAVDEFPFIDPPDTRTIRDGIALLEELGAVGGERVGESRWLTPHGRRLARLPLDPRLGRMLLAAADEDCLREVLVITAALSIIDPRERPTDREEQAAQKHRRFDDEASDFVSLLNLWRYLERERRSSTSSQFRRMCRDEYFNWRRVREWQDIHAQLRAAADEMGLHFNRHPADPELVHRALLAGLLSHVGTRDPDGFEYRGTRGARFAINPGSVLFKKSPPWVMAGELVETTRLWARALAVIDPATVEEVGAHLVKRTRSDPWWDAERGAAVAAETVTLLGLPLASGRRVLYHRFEPAAARRLFIHHALVMGEWDAPHEFLAHNAARIQEVEELEARGRRADMLVDEEAMVRFYDRRLPDDAVSVRHFERWWRRARAETPELLHMTLDDVIAAEAPYVDEDRYPAVWHYGDLELPLSYTFDPGSPDDGVTVEIPDAALDRIDPGPFEWQVPGLREELITALLRSLPKRLRRELAPLPATAGEIGAKIGPDDGSLIEVLRRELGRRAGVPVLPDDFSRDTIPDYLRVAYRIVDEEGAVVASGGDLGELKRVLREEARVAASGHSHPLERDGITRWDFGTLPQTVTLRGARHDVAAYPALVDEVDSVAIRLRSGREDQAAAMWHGVRRLLLLQLPSPGRLLRAVLSTDLQLALPASPYHGAAEWMEDCLACALDSIMEIHGGVVWDEAGFTQLLLAVRNDLADVLDRVGEQSAGVLRELAGVRSLLDLLPPQRFEEAVADIAAQIDRLIYPGFQEGVGAGRLNDLARYLAAVRHRLEKLTEAPQRDHDLMMRMQALEAEYENLLEQLPPSRALLDVGWMLEELRVSFFAQQIGAKGPVSEKRVRRALAAVIDPR